jgi:site-specific recombinase XerC
MNIWNVDDSSVETMMIVIKEKINSDKEFETRFSAWRVHFCYLLQEAQLLHSFNEVS